jgi:CRP-like cAMP-binding protein
LHDLLNYRLHPLQQHITKFVAVSDQEFDLIVSHARKRTLKKNQLLLQAGDQCLSDFFILDGCVKQYYVDDNGREHVLQYAFPGWWISDWYSILHNKPSSYQIEALVSSEALQFNYNSLQELFHLIPKLERYFRIIFQYGFAAQQRRILWLQMPLKERYSEFILVYGYFEKVLSQTQIASYLGTTRESLSRLRKTTVK